MNRQNVAVAMGAIGLALILWLSYDNLQLRRQLDRHVKANAHLVVNALTGSYDRTHRAVRVMEEGGAFTLDGATAQLETFQAAAERHNGTRPLPHGSNSVLPFHILASEYANQTRMLDASLRQTGSLTEEEQQRLRDIAEDVKLLYDTFSRELLERNDPVEFEQAWDQVIERLKVGLPQPPGGR